ncbi:MAG: DUF4493 domain-containing protein [Candidatus Cryptobacteroides sp.]
MKKILTLACGLLLVAVSCNKNVINRTSEGMGVLSIDMSFSGETRAALSEDQILQTAKVNIYKADFSGLVRSYTYSAMPSPMYLAADSYRVDVIAGEAVAETPAVASWENRSYKGSKAFEITAGNVTSVEVLAGVSNAVSSVSFDPSIAENFSEGYTFTIGLDANDAATQLVYDASKSGAEGYFIISGIEEPSFSWNFSGTLAKDASPFSQSGTISGLEAGKLYRLNLKYTIKDGDLNFTLSVDYSTDVVDDTIIFEPVSTGLASSAAYEIWAGHATVHADVDASEYAGATVQFAYSSDGASWTTVDAVNDAEGSWSATLTGLTGSTTYTYRLVINGEQVGDEKSFTTDAATRIPNGSFEYASLVSGQSYYKFYDPNCGVEEGQTMFWGSGNGEGSEGVNGSANMGIVITTIDTSDKADGNQSVCAKSSSMVGILAAGNIFTGQFAGLVGTSGGKVNFGRPWTTRPTALKLWCKYSTGKMNIIKNFPEGVSLTSSDYDRAEIKFAIGTWNYKTYGGTKDSPVHVNTTDASTFVDYTTDASTVAYGNLVIYNDGYSVNAGEKVSATTSGWLEYVIPLDFHDLKTWPTHIVVSCAASQYGDYFSGCDSSKLWVDKVELVYE